MTDPEQALARLPEDTSIVPEPLAAIVARAGRRRRRRGQGRAAAALVGVVALSLGVAALLPDHAQVVDTASRPGHGSSVPAAGGTAAKVVAEGDVGGGHWRLSVRPSDTGLCLDVEYKGRTSADCLPAGGPDRAIAAKLSTGLDSTFVSGPIRKDVAGVRLDVADGVSADLQPVGADLGLDQNFFVSPLAPGSIPTRAVAVDLGGATLGEVAIGPAPSPPDDEIAAPTPPTSVTADTRAPQTTVPPDDGGSQGSPVQTVPIGPPGPDPSLTACPPAYVAVTVTTSKAAFAVGERVTGSSVLQNRSSTACLVPARVRFAVQDQAGHDVSGFAYTADYALPIKADPGQSFPGTFTWDQTNCAGPACVQVPAGTYVVIGSWTEGGSFSARASFQVGP